MTCYKITGDLPPPPPPLNIYFVILATGVHVLKILYLEKTLLSVFNFDYSIL